MNARQERFVQEYLIDLNITQAAIRAGYSPRSAKQVGHIILKRPEIAARIAEAQAERNDRADVTQDYVITNLTEIVERCMQRAPVMRGLMQAKDEMGNALWEFDAKGATGALTLLGKHLGMFTDKLEHSGKVNLIPQMVVE